MKTMIMILILQFLLLPFLFSQEEGSSDNRKGTDEEPHFFLDDNGVTIKCENCQPGDTGTLNGITYEAVDRELLEQRIDEGGDLSLVCTSLVTDMDSLFCEEMRDYCSDISSWDVSNVKNMAGLFATSTIFLCCDISMWDVSNVTNMSNMFAGSEWFNQDISSWDVSNVTNMSGMFDKTISFNQDIGGWDVSNVTDMSRMFVGIPFNQDIGEWNVSNVKNMSGMFIQAYNFNQDIGSWDVSNVTDMSFMFFWNCIFNQDLSAWCVEKISNEPDFFCQSCCMDSAYHPHWGEECITHSENIQIPSGQGSLLIYPNPTKDMIFININEPGVYTLEVISTTGQVMTREVLNHRNPQTDLESLSNGVYYIRIYSDKIVRTGVVVKY